MKIDWMTPQEASEIWGITERRIQSLCSAGIIGAIKKGRIWLIPNGTQKPVDGRTKAAKNSKATKAHG